jgi:hypothetical protein
MDLPCFYIKIDFVVGYNAGETLGDSSHLEARRR